MRRWRNTLTLVILGALSGGQLYGFAAPYAEVETLGAASRCAKIRRSHNQSGRVLIQAAWELNSQHWGGTVTSQWSGTPADKVSDHGTQGSRADGQTRSDIADVAARDNFYAAEPGGVTGGAPPYAVATSVPQLPDPGNTGISKEQQEKLGLQAMAEVYKQMPVLPDSNAVTQYVQQLGKKLTAVIPEEDSWPYQFHVVAQKEINAFALPGGPIFVNIGTITAAQSEAQLAGVISHEMSHIYMQHSIKQMKTQQAQQGFASILGAILGQVGGVAGALGQLGVGVGSGMLSLKYSRGDEAQADSVGAIMMYLAGYDPRAMAQFFQTLEDQGGNGGPNFLSDHPNPGNRVAAVQKEIQDWPTKKFQVSSPQFARAKQEAQTIKAYAGQEIAQGAKDGTWERQNRQSGALPANLPVSPDSGSSTGNSGDLANVSYSQVRPSGNFVQTQNSVFTMAHPDNWQVFQSQNGGGLTIAPVAGVGQGAVAYGMMINAGKDPNAATLDEATQNLVGSLQQSNPGLRADGSAQKIQVDGRDARSVELQGKSPVQQNGQPLSERDWLIVLPNGSGGQLLYFVFIAPENTFGQLRSTYQRMLDSVQFP
jgi:beta-barrel assembly-enhancing protease